MFTGVFDSRSYLTCLAVIFLSMAIAVIRLGGRRGSASAVALACFGSVFRQAREEEL